MTLVTGTPASMSRRVFTARPVALSTGFALHNDLHLQKEFEL